MSSEVGFGDKVVVVTGAAGGIGRALATAFVGRGAHVVLADIDGDGAARVAREIASRPGRGSAVGVALDVTDPDRFREVIRDVTAEHGNIDILVNNAGTGGAGDVEDFGLEHWNGVIDVNLRGTMHGVAAAYPQMVERGQGHIVNIASLGGLIPMPLLTPYVTSKFGVVGMSLSLRAEGAPKGVKVTVVCPAAVETPLLDRKTPAGTTPVKSAPDVRHLLTNGLGKPYPPAKFAQDVLRAIEKNKTIVVAPKSAIGAWIAMRVSPTLTVRMLTRVGMKEPRAT